MAYARWMSCICKTIKTIHCHRSNVNARTNGRANGARSRSGNAVNCATTEPSAGCVTIIKKNVYARRVSAVINASIVRTCDARMMAHVRRMPRLVKVIATALSTIQVFGVRRAFARDTAITMAIAQPVWVRPHANVSAAIGATNVITNRINAIA